jgi:hypothetical protein
MKRVAVLLPGTELLESRNIQGICAATRFASGTCPAASVYGHAKVWTPLLDHPLSGPLYLRAGSGRLPEIAAVLDGQVRLEMRAAIDSVQGRLRITLQGLPDAPLSRAIIAMKGGEKGLLVNTGGLCARQHRVRGDFLAHNAKKQELFTPFDTNCRADKSR